MTVPGWPVAFRGSQAIAAGLITRARLRGPRYQRLLPDVYCRAVGASPDLLVRSLAAYRLVEGRGVLSGYSAALLLGADCAPRSDVPAEVTVAGEPAHAPGPAGPPPPLPPRPTAGAAGAPPRAPGCRPGTGGRRPGQPVCGLAYGDPAPTADHRGWAAPPHVQWVVQDHATRTAFWLDLAWPERKIGIEYEGAPHTEPGRVLRDIARHTRLPDLGWRTYRYTKHELYRAPARIIAELTRARSTST